MKTIYENYNDLEEAAKKLGFDISRLSDNRAVVFELLGVIAYTRTDKGWESSRGYHE